MSISVEAPIDELIRLLLKKAVSAIEEGKTTGQLKPQKIRFFKWMLKNFEYNEKGVNSTSARGEHFEKEDWSTVAPSIKNYLESLDIYIALDTKLKNQFSEKHHDRLTHFLDLFLIKYFNEKIKEQEIDEITNAFVKDLNGEAFECGAIVRFLGIALETPFVDLRNGVTMRQTQKSDLDEELPEYHFDQSYDGNHPSLIMNITTLGKSDVDVHKKIFDAEAILRLFKVGSIRYKDYEPYSKAMSYMFAGRVSSNDKIRPADVGFLKESEIESLKKFWQSIEDKVIIFTRLGKHSSFRDIAYQRYNDAILPRQENFERRITDCMMGLESIFLRDDGEQQELSYRLRMRVARVMSKFGFDAFKIKRMINEAYRVRSNFVHGGTLSYDDTKALEEKYESLQKFLLQLMDILRISIIITLMMDVEKQKFIDLIDGSFLEKKFEIELEQIVSNTRHIMN